MNNYLLKEVITDTVTKHKDFVISNNTEIIFSKYYQVRKQLTRSNIRADKY